MPIRNLDRWMVVDNDSGFTLFETLVATMILAVALVVVLQLFSGGLRANTVSNQYTTAIFHAREKMEEILLTPVLDDGQSTGGWEDGYSWRADIARQQTDDQEAVDTRRPTVFTIDLTVNWPDGVRQRQIAVSSLALAKAAGETEK